ncbi:hypothetical protein PGTUg99_030717 [Puccinia graminis f. sp. tritici]|uniref:Uncharacterized protein n=1 Tax=Puccinia graminis f. sp. tritici TaxID=56615 RepID=A0A5B0R9N0_PUCGR|nr:hypothetical protein PGTUg99_030717 [Puccinia graminis f. sp. tritici]
MKSIVIPLINMILSGMVQSIHWIAVDNWKEGLGEDLRLSGEVISFHENSPRTPLYLEGYNSEVPLNVYHFSLNHNICIHNPIYGKPVEYFLLDCGARGPRHLKWIIQPDTTHEILHTKSLFIYIEKPTT